MIPTIGFFNSKGGIGKTSLVYHLAWMLAERYRVLAVDLDPQTGLTEAFLAGDHFSALQLHPGPSTIYSALRPLIERGEEALLPYREALTVNLGLVAGELSVSLFEQDLAIDWSRQATPTERLTNVQMSCRNVIQRAAEYNHSEVVLVDLGPGFDAINRTALVACTHVIVPVWPHAISVVDLFNVGRILDRWNTGPAAPQRPLGYIVIVPPAQLDGGPLDPRMAVLDHSYNKAFPPVPALLVNPIRPNCLGTVKWYASVMPMARDARKPIFDLRPADGALGAHAAAVQDARKDYKALADRIAEAIGLPSPDAPR